MNVRVLIACHKLCQVSDDPLYIPLQVGAAGKSDFGFERDDTGDNISTRNPMYSELTGLYWAWKNLDVSHLGLVHYRRYFTLKNRPYIKKHGELESALSAEECSELLGKYRIIVPAKRNYYIETLYSHYAHTFDASHLDKAKKIIEQLAPEYLKSFDRAMNKKTGYMFNMFIMDKEMADAYCSWLFPILFELEKQIDVSEMTDFEKRYPGRVSERLFNVWLDKQISENRIKADELKELPYIYLGKEPWAKKIASFLGAKILGKKYRRSF